MKTAFQPSLRNGCLQGCFDSPVFLENARPISKRNIAQYDGRAVPLDRAIDETVTSSKEVTTINQPLYPHGRERT